MKMFVLLLALLFQGVSANAAFDENARRYSSAQEIIFALNMYFPLSVNCSQVEMMNRSALGVNSALTGNPIAPGPTQATVQWISGCVSESVRSMKYGGNDAFEKMRILVGDEAYRHLVSPIKNYSGTEKDYLFQHLLEKWNDRPKSFRDKMIAEIVTSMLGSDDVIRDFGLIEPDKLRERLSVWGEARTGLTVHEMIEFLSVNLALRDEFLSY